APKTHPRKIRPGAWNRPCKTPGEGLPHRTSWQLKRSDVGGHTRRRRNGARSGRRSISKRRPHGRTGQPCFRRFDASRRRIAIIGLLMIRIRAAGTYRLQVGLRLKTDDGALILVTYNGIGQTTAAGASLRIAPLFETGDARYVWLTRLQAIGIGERAGTTVTYDMYALK